jgi:DNA-binding NtrC family response regulator
MTNKVIWLIDDDHIYHIIMKKIIDRSGVSSNVVSFKNGKEAMQALEKLSKQWTISDLILLLKCLF